MKSTTEKRWQKAQEFERAYQQKKAAALPPSPVSFVAASIVRAAQLRDWLSAYINVTPSLRILEAGAGPHGSIHFLNEGERYAVDPLALFYRDKFRAIQADSGVKTVQAIGERLPFLSSCFDLVISENVLDHTMDPNHVIGEIHRVLRKEGIFLLSVNVSRPMARLMSHLHENFVAPVVTLNAFGPHPHCFSSEEIVNIIKQNGFESLSVTSSAHGTPAEDWRHKLIGRILKTRVLRILARKKRDDCRGGS